MLARDQARQVALFLLIGGPAAHLVHTEIGVGAVGKAYRGGSAGDFLHRHNVFEVAQAQAAELLLDGDTVQAECAHLWPELAGEGVGFVDPGGDRGDLVGGEARGGLADGVGRLAEAEVQRW